MRAYSAHKRILWQIICFSKVSLSFYYFAIKRLVPELSLKFHFRFYIAKSTAVRDIVCFWDSKCAFI